jgi:hypothetical protein
MPSIQRIGLEVPHGADPQEENTDMVNQEYPPERFDSVVLRALRRSTLSPTFTFPSQAVDRLARLEETRSVYVRDEREERLERAGHLLVVGIDRLVRTIAVFGRRVVRFLTRRSVIAAWRSIRADETKA